MNDVVSEHHQSKASNVLGGKTFRACDSCLVKRARWFCPGDDAFLCQACDTSVHSASLLASRHKRVRLETSSFKTRDSDPQSPAWLTRKARTPRQAKPLGLGGLANHLVPEISSEDPSVEETEEQLFCRVPVFDAFAEELIMGGGGVDVDQEIGSMMMLENDLNVEEMLINNVDEFSYVKVEEKDDQEVKDVIACHFDPSLDLELNWDFDSMINKEEEEEIMKIKTKNESRMLLRLNYDAVIAAWDTQASPWTDGIRPHGFNLDEFMVACLGEISDEWGGGGGRANIAGREARVSRYREKRRTRLFSKKIRYEVRKLNAEKRPRMKGRFVKTTTFSSSSLPYHIVNK